MKNVWFPSQLLRMEYYKFALLVVFLSYIERCWSSTCVVDSFTVKDNFDPKRVCSMQLNDFREDKSLHICILI